MVRRLTPVLRIAGAALLAALAVTGCASARATLPHPTRPGTTGAYPEIRTNGPADKLVSAQTSVGGRVQLRAPVGRQAGVMTMHTVPDIPIAPNAMTRLNPSCDHLLSPG